MSRCNPMQLPPLATTNIGSLPRPVWLAQTERSRASFRLQGQALDEAQDDATLLALRAQEELALDIATAINAELLDLQSAGCDLFQLDEPAMTRYHEKVLAYGARALERCLEGVTVPTLVHLCYGYPGGAELQHQYTYPELL